ncbi:MAG TPA: AhpC/TSA family protein, partial [Ktedonobacteraceae bacterium]|nr:AhpC/TSA family protein [Ktedonobacteraceae bacterium]
MAQDIVNSTLQQQLDDFKAQLAQQMPDTVARLGEDAEALVRTGIASQSLKEGEQAPDFTLPDAFGHSVTLSEFLKRGPVVLTFYR